MYTRDSAFLNYAIFVFVIFYLILHANLNNDALKEVCIRAGLFLSAFVEIIGEDLSIVQNKKYVDVIQASTLLITNYGN